MSALSKAHRDNPTIAVDPTNPNRLFAAWSDRGGMERGIPVATSDDGGVTWHRRLIADGTDGLFLPSQAGHCGLRSVRQSLSYLRHESTNVQHRRTEQQGWRQSLYSAA